MIDGDLAAMMHQDNLKREQMRFYGYLDIAQGRVVGTVPRHYSECTVAYFIERLAVLERATGATRDSLLAENAFAA